MHTYNAHSHEPTHACTKTRTCTHTTHTHTNPRTHVLKHVHTSMPACNVHIGWECNESPIVAGPCTSFQGPLSDLSKSSTIATVREKVMKPLWPRSSIKTKISSQIEEILIRIKSVCCKQTLGKQFYKTRFRSSWSFTKFSVKNQS